MITPNVCRQMDRDAIALMPMKKNPGDFGQINHTNRLTTICNQNKTKQIKLPVCACFMRYSKDGLAFNWSPARSNRLNNID